MGRKVNGLTDPSVEQRCVTSDFAAMVVVALVVLLVLIYASFGNVRMYVGRALHMCVIKYATSTINSV